MTALWTWTRLDIRRRWRSLVVLTLLVAFAGAVVMTATAGARRGASAADRLWEASEPAHAVVLPNEPDFDWQRFRELDYVEGVAEFMLGFPVGIEGIDQMDVTFIPGSDDQMRTVEVPNVYEGRVWAPGVHDEAVITRSFAEHYGLAVGDVLDVRLPSLKDQFAMGMQETFGYEQLRGPQTTVSVVGVIGSPWYADQPEQHGTIVLSPGFGEKYRAHLLGFPEYLEKGEQPYVNAMLRLENGEADVARLNRDVERLTGRTDIESWSLMDERRDVNKHLAFEAACLYAFAGAAFLAALVLLGQAIARFVRAGMAELTTLRALGLTPQQAVTSAALPLALVGLLAAGLAVGGAALGSWWMPVGTAALLEPSPGVQGDLLVLLAGAAVLLAMVVCTALVSALMAARGRELSARKSAVARFTADAGLPVPMQIGTRFAFEAGRGANAIPVRPALAASVAGALGVVAALTFAHGVQDASEHPERFGETFQAAQFIGFGNEEMFPEARAVVDTTLAELEEVAAYSVSRSAVATGPGGHGSATLWEISDTAKPLDVVITEGRLAETAEEVVFGPKSMKALGVGLGDEIVLAGSREAVTMTVVGEGFAPSGPHNSYADAGLVTTGGFDALFDGFKFQMALIEVSDDVASSEAVAVLTAAWEEARPNEPAFFDAPIPIKELTLLEQVAGLPQALAIFLVLLALGAVGHALATAVRRRALDLAVARAVGMTQWQARWILVNQATVTALLAVLLGVPLGLALGRTIWRVAADYTPVAYVPPTAVVAMLAVVLGALVLANLLAAVPARRAATTRIAAVLRAE